MKAIQQLKDEHEGIKLMRPVFAEKQLKIFYMSCQTYSALHFWRMIYINLPKNHYLYT